MHYLHLISLPSVCALLVAALFPLSRAVLGGGGGILVFCQVSIRSNLIPFGLSAKLPLTAAVVGG